MNFEIQWKPVNKERDGYADDDSILFWAEWGPYFLRVNDWTPENPEESPDKLEFAWGVWYGHEIVDEAITTVPTTDIAKLAAEVACKSHLIDKLMRSL